MGFWVPVVLVGNLPGAPHAGTHPFGLAAGGVDCALTICCCTARKLDGPATIRNISADPNAMGIIWYCLII
jgi:hypothetical protein